MSKKDRVVAWALAVLAALTAARVGLTATEPNPDVGSILATDILLAFIAAGLALSNVIPPGKRKASVVLLTGTCLLLIIGLSPPASGVDWTLVVFQVVAMVVVVISEIRAGRERSAVEPPAGSDS
jgi:peptidoglycan/LPS O-acetylase OafA/YrhL